METLFPLIIIGGACAAISSAIASKDNQTIAMIVGFLLGPFGILIAAIAFREGA